MRIREISLPRPLLPQRLETRLAEVRSITRLVPHLPKAIPSAPWNASRLLEQRAAQAPNGVGIAYLDQRHTWREIDRTVNRWANAFRGLGVGRGDVVALLMDNRPEFLFAVTALSRLRAVSALINSHVTGSALAHAIQVAKPVRVLVGSEHVEKLRDALPLMESVVPEDVLVQHEEGAARDSGFQDFDALVTDEPETPPSGVGRPRADEHMCYIYTSGTTGLPKAAIIKNSRWMLAGALFGTTTLELGPRDIVYVALPLYHSNAMFAGWGAVLITGACMALRRRFSASNFWKDVHRFDATAFVYIGELCRYLLNQPECPEERAHRIRVITGNGLRPDIWEGFQRRFRVPLIREFYGATEGNAPLVNITGRAGMVGRLRPGLVLVRCDLESGEVSRNEKGLCDRVEVGGTGLLLGKINAVTSYDGYVDPEATRKKILEDVFEKGDRYFNTGDLLVLHDDDWVSFADRVGDTFRWKGENVATNEVAEILNGALGVLETNVYGVKVPGAEGRAGMASINCSDDFSIEGFSAYVVENLPVYQRPYFVRLQREMRITGTFKHQKTDYRKEGYDPRRVSDPLYFLDGEKYVPLDEKLYDDLQEQRIALR